VVPGDPGATVHAAELAHYDDPVIITEERCSASCVLRQRVVAPQKNDSRGRHCSEGR
jgi:hypothetical protein